MKNAFLVLLTLGVTLAGAGYVSAVPTGSPAPDGVYLGISGGYELYLTREPLARAVEIGDSDAPLYLVSTIEGPVRLPGVATVHGFLPDGSAVCRLTREELLRLCGDPNLYFRRLMPVVRAPERPMPPGLFSVEGGLINELVEEVDLASIMAFDEDLAAFRTRYTTSEGNFQAQDYLAALLEEYGYEVEMDKRLFGPLSRFSVDDELVAMAGGDEINRIGECFFSNDGGEDFSFIGNSPELGDESWGGVEVFSPNTIHYAGGRFYYRSTNGGITWRKTEILDDEFNRVVTMFFFTPEVGYIFTSRGRVYRTGDGGDSWEARGMMGDIVYSAASPAGAPDTVLAAPRTGAIFRSTDGGWTWDRVYRDEYGDYCWDLVFEDGAKGLGVGGWVFVTTDAGETWERLDNPSPDRDLVSVSLLGPGEYLICNDWGGLWYTDDGGETWDDRSGGLDSVGSLITDTAYDDGRFWVLCSDYPGYSDDGGYSFTWLPFWLPDGFQGLTMTNVIGERRGTSRPDEYVYSTAHYDSTSHDSDPMELAPGANDNGSGSTALLELARVLVPYDNRRTLRFAFFDAEECWWTSWAKPAKSTATA
ncbi:MAG: M28 family peptidase [bacterium]|nr:M28 family peptidase [bacterium]